MLLILLASLCASLGCAADARATFPQVPAEAHDKLSTWDRNGRRRRAGLKLLALGVTERQDLPPTAEEAAAQGRARQRTRDRKPEENVAPEPERNRPDEDGETEVTGQAVDDFDRTAKKLGRIDEHLRVTAKEAELARRIFMPDFSIDRAQIIAGIIVLILVSAWFGVYFTCCMRTDRHELRKEHDDHQPLTSGRNTRPVDMVFVFHHPAYSYDDEEGGVPPDVFQKVLVPPDSDATPGSGQSQTFSRIRAQAEKPVSGGRGGGGTSKKAARIMFLKDFYEFLASVGFSVSIYSSVDDDELFVCATLEREEAVKYFIGRNISHMQLKHDIAGKLGVDQPHNELASSPAYVRYDPVIWQGLFKAGVVSAPSPNLVYKQHHGRSHGGETPRHQSDLISVAECLRIMNKEITRVINVDAAVSSGLLVSWYPVHCPRALDKLRGSWGNWRLLLDASFVQPVPFIKTQFGSRVAFDFAWIGFYCKAFLALLPVVFLVWLGSLAFRFINPISLYSISFAIWARMTRNFWCREEDFFRTLFDDKSPVPYVTLPNFHGDLVISPLDHNIKERRYPARKYMGKRLASGIITLFFSVSVFLFINLWMSVFEGRMGMTANLCLTVQIKIFELTYNAVADFLIDWENHKYARHLLSSYLWKQVCFQTVNNYAAFFYIVFQRARSAEGCRRECLTELQDFVTEMVVLLSVCAIADLLMRSAWVEYTLWREKYNLKKSAEARGGRVPERRFVEEQSKYASFRMREQVDQMLPFVLSLGYVLIFGALAPAAVPLCFLVYAFHLRASAYWITNYMKRAVPRKAEGIGGWGEVVSLQMAVGVIFSGFIRVNFGELFWGDQLLTRLTAFLLYCVGIVMLLFLVDIVFPTKDGTASLLAERRGYIERKVWALVQEKYHDWDSGVSKEKLVNDAMSIDEVREGQWAKIKHFDGSSVNEPLSSAA